MRRVFVLAACLIFSAPVSAWAQGDKTPEPPSWAVQARDAIMRQTLALHAPCKKKKHCETGVATVGFVAGRAGEINEVTIKTSSGSKAIDAMAVEAVRRAAPLPPFPASEPEDVHTRAVQINIRVK